MSIHKLASADVDYLMVKAAHTIRQQNEVIGDLRSQLAGRSRQDQAEKIASIAVDRGILDEDSATEYADDLANGGDNLEAIEQLVSRGAAGVPLGHSLQKTASVEGSGDSNADDAFITSLLTSEFAG